MEASTNLKANKYTSENQTYVTDDTLMIGPRNKRIPLWRRFLKMPLKRSLEFLWNLMTLFQWVLPLNITSRIWGWINSIDLPRFMRRPVYRLYSSLYGCDLQEMLHPELDSYRNLSEFFRRSIQPNCRPIDQSCLLVSPVDGMILSHGAVLPGQIQRVKGIGYTLQGFLGPITWLQKHSAYDLDTDMSQELSDDIDKTVNKAKIEQKEDDDVTGASFRQLLDREQREDDSRHDSRTRAGGSTDTGAAYEDKLRLYGTDNRLYHCIIYLAPGDYHKFHSPTEWTIYLRRHFPGKLLSVNPLFTSWIKDFLCINERAVYTGQWRHGFFNMTAVGANNVGSISVPADPGLYTNKPSSRLMRGATKGWHLLRRAATPNPASMPILRQRYYDRSFIHSGRSKNTEDVKPFNLNRGELFGEFNFGSTVVLIFEAPPDFEFSVTMDSKVKMGQSLGSISGRTSSQQ